MEHLPNWARDVSIAFLQDIRYIPRSVTQSIHFIIHTASAFYKCRTRDAVLLHGQGFRFSCMHIIARRGEDELPLTSFQDHVIASFLLIFVIFDSIM